MSIHEVDVKPVATTSKPLEELLLRYTSYASAYLTAFHETLMTKASSNKAVVTFLGESMDKETAFVVLLCGLDNPCPVATT